MKILSLSTCPLNPMLGSGKTRLRWSEGLRALGHTVDIYEPQHYETWHGAKRALRFRQAWGACGFVKKKLRESDYDLVEFFGGEFGLVTRQLSRVEKRPLIIAHTDGLELLASERERAYNPPASSLGHLRAWYSRQTHERLSRAAFVYADAFVTGCELDRQYVIERGIYSHDRAAVIAPGIDNEYLSAPFKLEKGERVAYAGSWIARKGVNILAAVMSRVLERRPDLILDLNGTGMKSHEVLAYFPQLLHDRIIVRPRMSSQQMAEALSSSKVFFFPTQYEGFGMALAEAMACGCAPVTTQTGFGAELGDGCEAMLCDFADADAMERAIITLLENEELRSRIARAARERVRELTWDSQIKKLEATYANWLSCHRHASPEMVENRKDQKDFKQVGSGS